MAAHVELTLARAPDRPVIELRNVWKIFGDCNGEMLQAIRAGNLTKKDALARYGCVVGVADATFTVYEGEIFCIMGLSGSGKSTLVRHINRLIDPTAGSIIVDGTDVGSLSASALRELRAEKIGMVFQNVALMPHRSVRDNVAFPFELRGVNRHRGRESAERVLESVQLGGWGDRYPAELSGGMQQRVGLARALASDPDVLLMDEPFSALDPLIRRQLQDEFLTLSREMKKTTVFITHDLEEAIRLGTRIAIIRDGSIVQIDTPERLVTRPVDSYVADFVRGISPLRLVRAATIMEPLPPALPAALESHPRAPLDATLDALISLSVQSEKSLIVFDGERPVGVIEKDCLLLALQGNEGRAQAGLQPEGPTPDAGNKSVPREISKEEKRATEATGIQWRAIAAGPLWAASTGLWSLFAVYIVFDLLAVGLILRSPIVGVALLVIGHLVLGLGAQWVRRMQVARRRIAPGTSHGNSYQRVLAGIGLYVAILPLVGYRLTHAATTARECRSVLRQFDETFSLSQRGFDCLFIGDVPTNRAIADSVGQAIDRAITFLSVNFQVFFDAIAFGVRSMLLFVEALFIGTPWLVMIVVLVAISRAVADWRVAAFTGAALTYLALFGFWASAMSTLVLVGAAALISISFGTPLGIWCAKNERAYALIRPVLDVMQTIPSFVYLIPAIAFFSIGKTPGVLATVIYSSPMMIRLTALGIQQVPGTVKEAALAFGATPRQLLLKVELPLALPSLMTGINQTIMMSLSMSVAAALIGAGGLGYDVLSALQYVEPGKGLLAGLAIAVCAMIIDRTIQGTRRPPAEARYMP